jgi:hypothetical protein
MSPFSEALNRPNCERANQLPNGKLNFLNENKNIQDYKVISSGSLILLKQEG